MILPKLSQTKKLPNVLLATFLSMTLLASCTKQDTLRIFAQQQNGDSAFGADVLIYPSLSNYAQEAIPVVTGKANSSSDLGVSIFEIEELFSGPHFYDVIFRDSIGNWGMAGAANSFEAISKGGELIEVGGADLGLNHHRFLLPAGGSSVWRLTDIEDMAGTSVLSNFPPCVNDNALYLSKDLGLRHSEGSSVCSGEPQDSEYTFTHGGDVLVINNFQGQVGATNLRISRSRSALIAEMGAERWIYTRD